MSKFEMIVKRARLHPKTVATSDALEAHVHCGDLEAYLNEWVENDRGDRIEWIEVLDTASGDQVGIWLSRSAAFEGARSRRAALNRTLLDWVAGRFTEDQAVACLRRVIADHHSVDAGYSVRDALVELLAE